MSIVCFIGLRSSSSATSVWFIIIMRIYRDILRSNFIYLVSQNHYSQFHLQNEVNFRNDLQFWTFWCCTLRIFLLVGLNRPSTVNHMTSINDFFERFMLRRIPFALLFLTGLSLSFMSPFFFLKNFSALKICHCRQVPVLPVCEFASVCDYLFEILLILAFKIIDILVSFNYLHFSYNN